MKNFIEDINASYNINLFINDEGKLDCKDTYVTLSETTKYTNVYVGGILKAIFDSKKECIVFSAKDIPSLLIRNYVEMSINANESSYKNNFQLYKNTYVNPLKNTRTELHTHFNEMLNGEEFLDLILEEVDQIAFHNGELVKDYRTLPNNYKQLNELELTWVTKNQINSNPELKRYITTSLSLPIGEQVPFEALSDLLPRRSALIDLVTFRKAYDDIQKLTLEENQLVNQINIIRSNYKAEFYAKMLTKALEGLAKHGIIYVEISYSTPNMIRKVNNIMKDIDVPITYKFLLSENRNYDGFMFSEYTMASDIGNRVENRIKRNKNAVSRKINELIINGDVIGFDLMGLEEDITEKDFIKDSISGNSLYDKLASILIAMNDLGNINNVFRLHAGEIYHESFAETGISNPEKILEIIDMIVKDNNIKELNLTIRIGHGLHVKPTPRYIELLKKYHIIVELNASSNFALSNIKDMTNVPYQIYTDNDIPIVISTDGGGVYYTNPSDEVKLAALYGGNKAMEHIYESDLDEIRRGL